MPEMKAAGVGCYVGGYKQHYVTNSIAEVRRASDLLSKATGMTVPVTAILVFVDPGPMMVDAPGGGPYDPDVRVVAERDLLRTMAGRAVFSAEQTAPIVGAAREPGTWHRHPVDSPPAEHMAKEFDALVAALAPAPIVPPDHVAAARPTLPAVSWRPRVQRPSPHRPAQRRPALRRPLPRRRSKK